MEAVIARLAAILALGAGTMPLCNVPVFRYALERWSASPYEAVVFHRGPLGEDQKALLREMRRSPANVVVEEVDVASPVDAALKRLLPASLPGIVVRYPNSSPSTPPAWSAPLDAESVKALLESPARQEMARRLVSGQSTVWVLLEGGDKAKDDAAAELLAREVAGLEKTLKLPTPAEDDPPLLSEVPLKIAFSVLRVARTDPAERAFVSMLVRSEDGLEATAEPVAFPVFGRGRALWPMTGKHFTSEAFAEAGAFLTGACSCQAKELNPGLDLLVSLDWPEALAAAAPPPEPVVPQPVIGPGADKAAVSVPKTPEGGAPERRLPVVWIGVALAAVLAGVTGLLLFRR
jgi:hypothetical protein